MKNLGKKAKDKITGFEGIIIGKANYLTGCAQYGITPQAKDGEVKESKWFNEGRIEITGEGISPEDVKAVDNGGPNNDHPTDK